MNENYEHAALYSQIRSTKNCFNGKLSGGLFSV